MVSKHPYSQRIDGSRFWDSATSPMGVRRHGARRRSQRRRRRSTALCFSQTRSRPVWSFLMLRTPRVPPPDECTTRGRYPLPEGLSLSRRGAHPSARLAAPWYVSNINAVYMLTFSDARVSLEGVSPDHPGRSPGCGVRAHVRNLEVSLVVVASVADNIVEVLGRKDEHRRCYREAWCSILTQSWFGPAL